MKFNKRFPLVAVAFFTFGQVICQMVILSGPEKGSYNRFVNDIVAVLGEKNGISLLNRPTGGSAYNFKALTNPSSADKIALIQSDYLNLMKAEDKLNNTNKTGSLRVLLQLAREEIQIVAKKSSGLKNLKDLDKKKVVIGDEDQGSFATGKIMRDRSKVNWTSYYAGYDLMLRQISAGSVDAGLIVGSAPVNILDIDPQVMTDGITMLELDDFNGWAKYYENDTIYRGEYKWLDKDIPTFGVRTLMIVNESKLSGAEKQTVESIKSGIIQNLDLLRKQGHPKWKEVIIPDESEIMPGIRENHHEQTFVSPIGWTHTRIAGRRRLRARRSGRPIRIVVPLPPGSSNDYVTRVMAPYLTTNLGQTIVVDNKAGANGIIGTMDVVKSAPDGNTLLLGSLSPLAINVATIKNLPYDPRRDPRRSPV